MNGKKLALITGATSGMGYATAVEMAKKNYAVVMLGRNVEKGLQAAETAKRESGSQDIEFAACDLASLDSIRAFATEFIQKHDTLDVLINNAGVLTIKRQETQDGFEMQLGVNHLGHFLLTNLLLDLILDAEAGRIVNVSSGGHKWGTFYEEDPHMNKSYNVIKGYGQSKLANILFTKELALRLQDTNVLVNTLHPGAVATNLGVDRKTGFGKTIYKLLTPVFQTPAEGAATAIFLASSPDIEGVSGEYFYKKKIHKVSDAANDQELGKRLWAWSEREVNYHSLT